MARQANITLVQAPLVSRLAPCNGLALIKAHLQAAGISARIHDASLNLRRGIKAAGLRWHEYQLTDADHLFDALAASLPEFLPAFIDKEAQSVLSGAPDVVGFTVQYATEACSLALARRIKELSPGTAVVFGGPQCIRETKAFELAESPWVDAVALGEADLSFVEFARVFNPESRVIPHIPGFLVKEKGRVLDFGDPPEFKNLDELPFMDFSGFEMDAYRADSLFMVASRGCVRKCSFCTEIVQRKTYRRMSAERILAEIRHQLRRYPDRCFVRFDDSLINGDVRLVARLSELLAPFRLEMAVRRASRDFGWGGMAILHPTMTASLLKKMRQGGCQTLAYGFESGSQKVVDLMRKGFKVEEAQRIIRDTHAAGIRVQLFVMVGYPGETDRDFRQTLDFLERNEEAIDIVSVSMCGLLKGSHIAVNHAQYGAVPHPTDARLWSSADGTNTPAVRQARHQAVFDAIRRLGFQASEDSPIIMEKNPESALCVG